MKIFKKYFPLIIAVIALGVHFKLKIDKKSELEKNAIRSVAKVYKLVSDQYVYSQFRYEYFYEGKRYTAQRGLGDFDEKKIINNFYEIEFSSKNPKNSRIHLNLKVVDSKRISEAGFKKIINRRRE